MASIIRIKRHIGGAQAAPAGANNEGELAIFFPGTAGSTGKPTLYANDGGGWRTVNPSVTVNTQAITLPAAGDIGAAYTAWAVTPANTLTGNIVIATFGTPAQAYVLTNPGAPAAAASWTSLGGAVSFASANEIHAGTDATKAINSLILRGETLAAPTGTVAAAVDADRIVRLNQNGQVDPKFLPAAPTSVRPAIDPTVALVQPNPAYAKGDMVFTNKSGTVHTDYTGAAGTAVKSGDSMLFDGTNWHVIPNETDLEAYVPLAGTSPGKVVTGAINWAAGQTGTILDGQGGVIDNVTVDGGGY
jgi:hypothetical protein